MLKLIVCEIAAFCVGIKFCAWWVGATSEQVAVIRLPATLILIAVAVVWIAHFLRASRGRTLLSTVALLTTRRKSAKLLHEIETQKPRPETSPARFLILWTSAPDYSPVLLLRARLTAR